MAGARRAALLGALAALAGCTAPVATSRQAIVGGELDTGDPAIVLWIAQQPGSSLATICTATLVSPHVLLTAAHCVTPALVGASAEFSVYGGPDVDKARASDLIPVAETHYDTDFSPTDVTKGGDVAVGILAQPLGPTPIPMNRTGLGDEMVGQAVRMVGYGKTDSTDTTGATAGTKRQVTTTLVSYTDKLVRVGMAGQTTCEGDSGGPGLMTIDGVEAVVGVVSFGDPQCAQLGVDTRVDVYADDWVQPYVDRADPGFVTVPGGKSGGGCAMGGGVPAAPGWLALAVLVALLRRSSRRPQTLR